MWGGSVSVGLGIQAVEGGSGFSKYGVGRAYEKVVIPGSSHVGVGRRYALSVGAWYAELAPAGLGYTVSWLPLAVARGCR